MYLSLDKKYFKYIYLILIIVQIYLHTYEHIILNFI